MATDNRLSEMLLTRLGDAPRDARPWVGLEDALCELHRLATSAWPDIAIEAPCFVEHLADHTSWEDAKGYLSTVRASDMYLALACAKHIPVALAAFDRTILSAMGAYLAGINSEGAFVDEMRQRLRIELFVGTGDRPLHITEYDGTRSLAAWVRLRARWRARTQMADPSKQFDEIDDQVIDAVAGRSPEESYFHHRCWPDFRLALREAMRSLPRNERVALRLHFVGGLSGVKIAAMQQVDRTSVGRWMGNAKKTILKETRRLLRARLKLSDVEFDTLIAAVQDRIDTTIGSLIPETDEARGEGDATERRSGDPSSSSSS